MNIFDLITKRDYISLVKEFIEKVFVNESRKYKCRREDLDIILHPAEGGQIQVLTYLRTKDRVLRVIPDKEVQNILIK